jgi:excinuclease ABC subunit A
MIDFHCKNSILYSPVHKNRGFSNFAGKLEMLTGPSIAIHHATEHNLRSVSLEFPKNRLIIVTGVSGSGKSSLVFDVLYREAEMRYLGSFSGFARQFMGKMTKPAVDRIDRLSPAVALDQKSVVASPRSTVGTITGIYDLLRLLYARVGEPKDASGSGKISRSLFSFNSAEGACRVCKGLGVEDFLDPLLLIADENRTLREGALRITTPKGYIIYSQVTMEVLDQVCRAEGFNVDIPWRELTEDQKHIVLFGSERIEIPYGKHPLESRMKWSGITAKPRELGFYKGILPVMEAILQRDRNKNILRFVRTRQCQSCRGTRLSERALSVTIGGRSIAELAALPLDRLGEALAGIDIPDSSREIAASIIAKIGNLATMLTRLGLGHLAISRESASLSGGESQRIRLASIAGIDLSGMIFVFDEPSVGLHPTETESLAGVLKAIRDRGNTVIVVEHDLSFVAHADWLIDIGPGPGLQGGEVIYNGPVSGIAGLNPAILSKSRTLTALQEPLFGGINGDAAIIETANSQAGSGIGKSGGESDRLTAGEVQKAGTVVETGGHKSRGNGREYKFLTIRGACVNNLKNIDVSFTLNALNVITGASGAGKSSLAFGVLVDSLGSLPDGPEDLAGKCHSITGWEQVRKLITVDQLPIGKTPRSNPATYTGVFDHIRDYFANLPEAVSRGYEKSRFSFNTPGGRCETCEGAGYQQIGMHFMGTVEVLCEACEGRRFDEETLEVGNGKNISEVLGMTVREATDFFSDEPKIGRYLSILEELGLGYLTLGQRSSTLSGGESQRVKLAYELAKPQSPHSLFVMDEPTTGLHNADVSVLMKALKKLVGQGHTVIVIEHHPAVIAAADHIIDLGPGSGEKGGTVVAAGTLRDIIGCQESLTGSVLRDHTTFKLRMPSAAAIQDSVTAPAKISLDKITLAGVSTHNLRGLSLTIPHNRLTVLTGISGSGKSSLAFDTIHAEAQNRFMDAFSAYVRMRAGLREKPESESIDGLTPTLALEQSTGAASPRSTVGTMTGIYDLYRLLYARIGGEREVLSSLFSFNHRHGACPVCTGLGSVTVCDPARLITHPSRSILDGAMDGTRTGKFYGDPYGQYTAVIRAVGTRHGIDFSVTWDELDDKARSMVMNGTGDEQYDVVWEYKRGVRTGEHRFTGRWEGLAALVEAEYMRKHADHRGEGMMNVMTEKRCGECGGSRLRKEALEFRVRGLTISKLAGLPIGDSLTFFSALSVDGTRYQTVLRHLLPEIAGRLTLLNDLGLSYLSVSRPADSISSGEARRVKLASLIGSGLTGITYVLDEPSAGLHPSDISRLMVHLRALRDAGNTVIMVEHDPEVIVQADHIIDLGPGAGRYGGALVAAGDPTSIMNNPSSLTGQALLKVKHLVTEGENAKVLPTGRDDQFADQKTLVPDCRPEGRPDPGPLAVGESDDHDKAMPGGIYEVAIKGWIRISGACMHNLKGFDLEIPVGSVTAVTGVSGSGKSTLVFDTIYQSSVAGHPIGCRSIDGLRQFGRIITVERKNEFTNAQASVSTYTGVLEHIRDVMASQPAAIGAGFKPNHFSYLNREGQCPRCEGSGQVRTSMDFLPDIVVDCESCGGMRYGEEILRVNYLGKNMGGILDLTVTEAAAFFSGYPVIVRTLSMLDEIGLGYLALGQPLNTLSGGEAQRLSLSTEIMRPVKSPSLYLFDEPSTGLHPYDCDRLIRVFGRLSGQGHTVIMIEHDPVMTGSAGFVVELGPGGGEAGGFLLNASWRSR